MSIILVTMSFLFLEISFGDDSCVDTHSEHKLPASIFGESWFKADKGDNIKGDCERVAHKAREMTLGSREPRE